MATNYQDLRAKTLGSTQEEEAVTVNTRALIDKVLARYSSENTTLRELIQNAADAGARSVAVKYETTDSSLESATPGTPEGENLELQQLIKAKVRRLQVQNDGVAFREEDWQRLKRIAEGNPDETKIGAFGVGFYSVFADTDEPFISSGNQTMAFYWKGNSLFTRRAKMEKTDPFTTFFLDYREPGDLPDLKILCQFFATSLTFVNLQSISLYVDGRQLLELNKKVSPAMPLDIPYGIHPVSQEKLMRIAGVETSRVQLDAKYMNVTHYKPPAETAGSIMRSFFSRVTAPSVKTSGIHTGNLSEYTRASIFLRIATATVTTSVTQRFAQELERATKKPPPQKTMLACLTMSKDEQEASENESEIFQNVIPNRGGKIFIGFPTHQTTAFNAHISAHSVIPTVERENIDLNARIIKTWNIEMLRTAGILARIIYSDEMVTLGRRVKNLDAAKISTLHADAIHIMRQFTFGVSTPSSSVGAYIAEAFWSCTRSTVIELFSTKGVLPSTNVRLSSDIDFLEGLPFLPRSIVDGAKEFVNHLKQGGYLTEVSVSDIQNELAGKPLTLEKTRAFLKWLSKKMSSGEMDDFQAQMLLDGAVAMLPTQDPNGEVVENGLPLPLGNIKRYVNVAKLAPDIPLPSDCIPFTVTKTLLVAELEALHWQELGVTEWAIYVANNSNRLPVENSINRSPVFANQVLSIVSKNWERIPPVSRNTLVDTLKLQTCISTKQGMKLPKEAYFPTVKLFSDLPIIYGIQNVKEKVLATLGVRKTVELRLVFDRMNDTSADGAKWSHVELIKYLASVREDIPKEDIKKLRNSAICKTDPVDSIQRYRVSQLYEPSELLRPLQLPIIHWPGEWREQSPEAKFLSFLGLQRYPTEEVLIELAASKDAKLRERALAYYIRKFYDNGYSVKAVAASHTAFLPVEGDKTCLVRPFECFSNPNVALFQFNVLRHDLQEHAVKFGVNPDPEIRICCTKIKGHPPKDFRAGKDMFEYLAKRSKELNSALATELGSASIVPIKAKSGIHHIPPRICYIGDSYHKYAKIFDFVDFGAAANAFLIQCGSKPEPTTAEIAYRLAAEPIKLYSIFQSDKKYLGVLRSIADEWGALRRDTDLVKALQTSRCLGAYRVITVRGKESGDLLVEDESDSVKEFQLAKAQDIVLVDDITCYSIFREKILTAPEEDSLEKLYRALGSKPLTAYIRSVFQLGAQIDTDTTPLKKKIFERSRLFLHNTTEEVERDAQWLEKNIEVKMAQQIKQKRTLGLPDGQRHIHDQQKTAAIIETRTSGPCTLFVTPKYQTYDLAVALVSVLLVRPKPHSSLLLDSLITTDLYTLKARGYNVDRILRAKQAEARLIEQERLKKLAEEKQELERKEKVLQEQRRQMQAQVQSQVQSQQQAVTARQSPQVGQSAPEHKSQMPGAFGGDSPESKPQSPPPPYNNSSFLSKGFSKFSKLLSDAEKARGKTPDLPKDPQHQGTRTMDNMEKATEPHRLSANLQRAVQASRRHDSDKVFSPPTTFNVKEEQHFCDSTHGQDIVQVADTPAGIKVYMHRAIDQNERTDFLRIYNHNIMKFSELLIELSRIFNMDYHVLHVFYDPQGSTIAFNLNGSIFCNIRFFLQLHVQGAGAKGWAPDAVSYWYVTLCHELAHNLVKEHSSNHSFYTESFISEYFTSAMQVVTQARQPQN